MKYLFRPYVIFNNIMYLCKMFKKFWYNILVVVLSVLILSSCSDYQKILKSSDYDLKLKTALELYENKDYARAESLFEELIRIYNGQEEAEQIFY